ncbi:hypothetical protein BX616_003319, partial [Lobosporangium transversale]
MDANNNSNSVPRTHLDWLADQKENYATLFPEFVNKFNLTESSSAEAAFDNLIRSNKLKKELRNRLIDEFNTWKKKKSERFWTVNAIRISTRRAVGNTAQRVVRNAEGLLQKQLDADRAIIEAPTETLASPSLTTPEDQHIDEVQEGKLSFLLGRSPRGKRLLNDNESAVFPQSNQESNKKLRFDLDESRFMAPGNPFEDDSSSSESFIPTTLEDSTGEYSVIIDRPQRIVRLVGPGQESSSLTLDHWCFGDQDVSQKLMQNRASLVKCHEDLQADVILDITEAKELAPTTCCQPIRSSSIALAISELAFTAANDGYLATVSEWRKIRESIEVESEHGEKWEVLQKMLDHMFITATLWSPLKYTSKRKGNEDSFYTNIVRPFLTCAFGQLPDVKLRGNGDRFTCGYELDKELLFPDFAVTMECYRKALGEHYLAIAEVKPPSASQDELDDDFIKLPNLMKSALDHQIAQGYGDGTVVGLL